MRISELASASALSIDTIRFYEKMGLLDAAHFSRQLNGYRDYSESAVQRLQLIQQAKAAGFTLSEIESLIGAWESDALSWKEKRALLTDKIAAIKERMGELERILDYLEQKLENTLEDAPASESLTTR